MLIDAEFLIQRAARGKYAVPGFSVFNLETAIAVGRAAVEAHAPLVIQISEDTITYAGVKPITHVVSTIAKNVAAHVPIALHLDHGRSFATISECISAGFTSVHLDASDLAYDENVALTTQVVEFAHPKNVWVQGELGAITGGSKARGTMAAKVPLTDPEQVPDFVARTGIDSLAIAIGTSFGRTGEESIQFDLLHQIRRLTDVPLVLHGASGIPDADITKAIEYGINKVNIGTDIKEAFIESVVHAVKHRKPEDDVYDLFRPGIRAVENVCIKKIKLFGAANKA